MSTSISGYFNADTVYFSSNLPSLTISSDRKAVNVRILLDGVVILSEAYYPDSFGRFNLYDIGDLAAHHMQTVGSIYGLLRIEAEESSREMTVVCCSRHVGMLPSLFLRRHFLTTCHPKLLGPDDVDFLTSPIMPDENRHIACEVGYSRDGKSDNYRYTVIDQPNDNRHFQTVSIGVSPRAARERIASLVGCRPAEIRIHYLTFTSYSRHQTYMVGEQSPNLRLLFRNAFNCLELASLHCSVTEKLKATAQSAISQRGYELYDRTSEQTYEVEAANLPIAVAQWLRQLVDSHDVQLVNGDYDPDDGDWHIFDEVQITDSTSETLIGDAELSKLKFTYRYLPAKPRLEVEDTDRIHTAPFDAMFT